MINEGKQAKGGRALYMHAAVSTVIAVIVIITRKSTFSVAIKQSVNSSSCRARLAVEPKDNKFWVLQTQSQLTLLLLYFKVLMQKDKKKKLWQMKQLHNN